MSDQTLQSETPDRATLAARLRAVELSKRGVWIRTLDGSNGKYYWRCAWCDTTWPKGDHPENDCAFVLVPKQSRQAADALDADEKADRGRNLMRSNEPVRTCLPNVHYYAAPTDASCLCGNSKAFTPRTDRRVTLTIDRIPPTLLDAAKAKAKREGVSLRAFVLGFLKSWAGPREET